MRLALAAALALLAAPALAQQTRVDGRTLGCKDKATLEEVRELLARPRRSALIPTGQCRSFETGETAQIERVDARGMHCLRGRGDSDCYWTPPGLLR